MNFPILSSLIVAAIVIGVPSEAKEKKCEPGEIQQSTCGPCRCLEDGSDLICEKIDCLSPPSIPQAGGSSGKRIARGAGDRCIPNSVFKRECNTCMCPSSGILADAACTLMACPPNLPSPYSRRYNPRFYRW